ncbi:MAG: Npt1/Npt2 family nucleotide transporter [Myxococcota bacterium]
MSLPSDELRLAGAMLVYQFLVVCTFITGRTVRDTLFLRRADPSALPSMYVLSAVAVALGGWIYSRFADRYRRDKTGRVVLMLSGVSMASMWALINLAPELPGIYAALYALVEVLGSVCIIQFWTTANDIFTSQQAKRLFGLIGAGGVLANILCGVGVGGLSLLVGPTHLLLLNAGLFGLASLVVVFVGHTAGRSLEDAILQPRRKGNDSNVLYNRGHGPLLRAIGAAVAITFLVVTLVDFQFKIAARETFAREADLAAFFGYFYGVAGIIGAFVQIFLTSRILTRVGIVAGLSVLPLAILAGSLAWLVFPAVIVGASLMRGAENVFRYTVHDATIHLLYVPIPGHQRGRAKAFIDGVLKPGAIGLCGVLLFSLTRLYDPGTLARIAVWVDIGLVLLWLAVVVRIRRGYIQSLAEALQSRNLERDTTTDLVDDDTRSILIRHLKADSDQELLHAMDLVREWDIEVRDELLEHLDHANPEVRAKALQLLESSATLDAKAGALARIEDVDPRVRAAAVGCLCAIDRDGIRVAVRLLADANLQVRAAVIVAIARYGDFQDMLTAARALEELLASSDEDHRLTGATIISKVRWADFFRTILRLLADPSVKVRRRAIQAAGQIGGPDVLLPLIRQLSEDEVAPAAVQALASLGSDAQEVLLKVLEESSEDLRIRRRVPRILAAWGDRSAYDALLRTLDTRDPELRSACARAAARIRERHPAFPLQNTMWSEAVHVELRGIARDHRMAERVQGAGAELLAEALQERGLRRLERLGDLFVLRYPNQGLRAAFLGIRASTKRIRSQAWELLENVVERTAFTRLLNLLGREEFGARVDEAIETRDLPTLDEHTLHLASEPVGWVAATALHFVAQKGDEPSVDMVLERCEARDPLIRETALYAAHTMGRRFPGIVARVESALERGTSDRNPIVANAANDLLRDFSAQASQRA